MCAYIEERRFAVIVTRWKLFSQPPGFESSIEFAAEGTAGSCYISSPEQGFNTEYDTWIPEI
jgi:hypothetical protein